MCHCGSIRESHSVGLFGSFHSSTQSKYSPKRVIITSMKSPYAFAFWGGGGSVGRRGKLRHDAEGGWRLQEAGEDFELLREPREQPCVPAVALRRVPVRPA